MCLGGIESKVSLKFIHFSVNFPIIYPLKTPENKNFLVFLATMKSKYFYCYLWIFHNKHSQRQVWVLDFGIRHATRKKLFEDFVNSFWSSTGNSISQVNKNLMKNSNRKCHYPVKSQCTYYVKNALTITQDFIKRKAENFSQVDFPKIRGHTFMTYTKNDQFCDYI